MPNILFKIGFALLLSCSFSVLGSPVQQGGTASILLNTKSYSVSEGLSESAVSSITEDRNGYVWIGTINGLNRFDGEEFKHYFGGSKTADLPSSFIRSLLIDKEARLLVGTDAGVAVYNEETDDFNTINQIPELADKPIWSIREQDDNIIFSTENSIIIVDKDLEHVVNIITSEDTKEIKQVIPTASGFVVRNYSGAIYTMDNVGHGIEILKHSFGLELINNKVVASTDTGTFSIYENRKNKINSLNSTSLTQEKDKIISITNKDIEYLDENYKKLDFKGTIDIEKKLLNPVLFRGKKALFITTANQGFIVISDTENIISKINIENENTWSINREKNETLVSTDAEELKLYDENFEVKHIYNTKIKGPKSSIQFGDKIFSATSQGLYSIDKENESTVKLSDDYFSTISSDYSSEKIYTGTVDGKLIEYDNTNNTIKTYIIDNGNPIFNIHLTSHGIWLATQGGLFLFRDGKTSNIYKDDIVISINSDKDFIYYGTRTSLNSYNLKSKKTKILFNNNKAIYAIALNDEIIVSSSLNEIVIILKKDNKKYILSNRYGSQHEYNAQAITINNKNVLFGGTDGVSLLSLDKMRTYFEEKKEPKTQLQELLIFNSPEKVGSKILPKTLSFMTELSLKHSDYPFSIKFRSPGSFHDEIEYMYQMTGLSDDWISAKNINAATYTNLSPGNYTFKVYGINSLTGEHGKISQLALKITPPWWLSVSAKLVYFLIFMFIAAAILKIMLRRREVQKQIAQSEERLKLSLWGSGDEMWDWDIETGKIYRSNIWGSLEFPRDGHRAGASDEESNIHPMDQLRVREALTNHFKGTTDHFEVTYRVKGKANDWIWILDRAKIVERDVHDNPLRMTGTIKNISNFKQAEEQLRLFERAIENISEGMFILDDQFRFVEVNEACCTISQRTREDFIGEQLHFERYPNSFSDQIKLMLKQQGRWSNDVEASKGHADSFLMELTIDAIYDEQGELSHYVGVFSDISRRKQQEEELRKLTNNDLLTGLPNRSNLQVTLSNLVKKDTHHTLMVLDLDNFKKINDSLGHQIGDDLLCLVAERIQASIPSHTSVYRLGGDEFAVLIDKNPDIGSSAAIANQLIEGFKQSFDIQQESLVIGVSIGIVLYPEDEQNEQALLRKADIAMYHAKSAGGNRYQFFSESLNRNAIRQLEIENLIREGLKEDYFEVYYQPKVDVKLGKIAGMEALVRLKHPSLGLIPPNDFIPQAEENGLIVEIGDLVLRKACFAAQKWREQGLFSGRVAVNLSSRQFALPDLQQRIESILRLTKLPACHLELEITEGTVIKQPEVAIKVMQQLAKMGISLSLDDFGTGYSSLSYLKRFPIHTLKIDKAFIDDIDKSDRDLKMVDSIITIAHNMGLSVVGEGVEVDSQLNILRALNCEEIQGFIYSKAIEEQQFTQLLQQDKLAKKQAQ
ncbi:EAL domain-containing protein [Shewanella sp. AS16]|uniref:EAL domain-containing protein n=1 Tax=Shewanella sp. AS16 TaxID=2907625 RepID=UPI001F4507C1|nr:EAL domain-containing protein [Shewanella sp. AS16]MCE9686830.1 EAL domain-containing protein [Shewanella sp. AS16]